MQASHLDTDASSAGDLRLLVRPMDGMDGRTLPGLAEQRRLV